MQSVLQCFHESRGPLTTQSELSPNTGTEDPVDGSSTSLLPLEAKDKPMKAFERLLNTMLNAPPSKVDVGLAFRITQYVCDRVQPDAVLVSTYLKRFVEAFTAHPAKESDREIASAAVLLWATHLNAASLSRVTRGVLLRIGIDLKGDPPDMNLVQGLARLLGESYDFVGLWVAVGRIRTPQEEVRAYHLDTRKELPECDYPFLSSTPEWNCLNHASRGGVHFLSRYSDVCPFCFNMLPTSSAFRLQMSGITTHCGKILLCEEL